MKVIEAIFIFSLVWSIGASTENEGRAKFNEFFRKLLDGGVEKNEDRTDYDLGPGLEIIDPGFKLAAPMPKVGGCS